MAFHFQFGVLGEQQIDRTLEGYSSSLEDLRPVWDDLADSFQRMEKRQFNSQGAFSGDAWSPLSPAYAAWKARHYGNLPILQRERRLIGQLTSQPFGVDVRELNYALFGTALPYAVYHQQGAGNLPKRRVINMTQGYRREWVKILQRHLHEAGKNTP